MTTYSEDELRARAALRSMSADRRLVINAYTGGGTPSIEEIETVNQVLKALAEVVGTRQRVELRGLGVFEWKPTKGRLPDGRRFDSWRMVFKYNQKRRFHG